VNPQLKTLTPIDARSIANSTPDHPEELTQAIAARIKIEREGRGWTIAALAEKSGVSIAMISRIERGEASPTAALLGKLSGAFGLSLSTLLGRAENSRDRIARLTNQPVWQDPDSGYTRRSVSPSAGAPLELIDVSLPANASVRFPASAYTFLHQQIWIRSGTLHFSEGDKQHILRAGDCIQLGAPSDCRFENLNQAVCRYVVAIVRR
jgi:transcriptional regulator with XRE-family HTH domain